MYNYFVQLKNFKKHYFKTLPNLLIFFGILLVVFSLGPLIKDEVWFYLKELKNQEYSLFQGSSNSVGSTGDGYVEDSVFARFLSARPVSIEPVNREFSIVIERIGVNAPVVKNVPVMDKNAYKEALKNGVAHAFVSKPPSSEPGNVYLFAHASLNFWELGKYATTFNLLRKLESGDRIYVFYEQKAYVYEVINKEIVKGWDTYPLTRPVIEPILTLQTCDPPGTTLNRLVVTSKLKQVQEL